jgi:hypothetical protein
MNRTVFLKDGVLDYYKECKSAKQTASFFGYKYGTFYSLLKREGIDTTLDRNAQRKRRTSTTINEDYFQELNTRNKAYIFGIILSDGHLLKNRKQLRIKLTDIDLLEEIKKELNYNKPLLLNHKEKITHKEAKTLIICNTKIYDDLLSLGMLQNKTFTLKFPSIPNHLMPDFIRGFFDGNGSAYFKKVGKLLFPNLSICSTVDFLIELQVMLTRYGVNSHLYHDINVDERITTLMIRDIQSGINFFNLLYSDTSGKIFLDRKFQKFISFFESRKLNYNDYL